MRSRMLNANGHPINWRSFGAPRKEPEPERKPLWVLPGKPQGYWERAPYVFRFVIDDFRVKAKAAER